MWYEAVAADAGAWAVWGLATSWVAHRVGPVRLPAPKPWERRVYRRVLRVHRWKHRLPDAGSFDKRRVGGRSTERLEAYAAEARRAELVHWLGLVAVPAFALWNPPGLVAANLAYALGANGPCLVSLRYNRGRLEGVLAVRARREST